MRNPAALALSVLLSAVAVSCGERAPSYTTPVTMKLAVKGMHCEGCESAICEKVGKLGGVTACKASHESEEVEVIAPAEQKDAIAAAIKKLGYTVE
ncbi:MAG: Heavy-metal-associated domain [Planctomycetota bacterium]|jgi:copper chaperone CopZ